MAVVGDLEMVVATKAQLQKALIDAGLPPAEQDVDRIWKQLDLAGLLQGVKVEVDLAVNVDFGDGS